MKKDQKLLQHCTNTLESSDLSIAEGAVHLLSALLKQSNANRVYNVGCYAKDHKEYDYEMDINTGAISSRNVQSSDDRLNS